MIGYGLKEQMITRARIRMRGATEFWGKGEMHDRRDPKARNKEGGVTAVCTESQIVIWH